MSLFTREEPRLRFEQLHTENDVADALASSLAVLQRFKDETFKGPFYHPIYLKKKGRRHQGEHRLVFEVARDLRRVQTEVLESLKLHGKLSDRVFGFVRGRSTVDNAQEHHGAALLLNVDIKDFFDSIREGQVLKAFRALGTGEAAARLLSAICCLQGRLPQGAATSPILSNLVCTEMDLRLADLGERKNAAYTRYADDISFSGNAVPEIDSIENVLSAFGFSLNPNKGALRKAGEAQYVTGLTIGAARGVRLPKHLRRYLRLQLYYGHKWRADDDDATDELRPSDDYLSGLLAYAFSVEPEWTVGLMKRFPLGVPSDWEARSVETSEPPP